MGNNVSFGTVTILVNVSGDEPLVLTGVIEKEITLDFDRKKHDQDCDECGEMPICIGSHGGSERERFLVLEVTAAILPREGFPLTIAQLVGTDVAINEDYIILIFPVEA